MQTVRCPVCGRRLCDSNSQLLIRRLAGAAQSQADLVIKCSKCSSNLGVTVRK